jgi:uncharacterized membrane protein
METNPLELPATTDRLKSLTEQGHLSNIALERALFLAEYLPGPMAWRKFLDMALLVLGAAFTLSGILFFFAYNWADLPYFVKFGLVEAGIIGATGLAFYLGLDGLPGKISLSGAALLVGILLAVFGQIYQTGADAYQLFLGWSLLVVGWVAISRFDALWLGWLVLLNLTLITYWNQAIGEGDSPALFVALAGLDTLALLVWEYGHWRGIPWLQHRWLAWLITPAIFIFLVLPTLEFIFTNFREGLFLFLAPLFYLAFTIFALIFYQKVSKDLFILTLTALSLIVVLTAALIKVFDIDFDNAFILLLMSLIIIGETALAVFWLRHVAHTWEASHA